MAACSILLFPGLFYPVFGKVSLACSGSLLLPSFHFHPFLVKALILYLCRQRTTNAMSCSHTYLTSYGLLIILFDISISFLSPCFLFLSHFDVPSFLLKMLNVCPVSFPLHFQRVRCSSAASPCCPITTWPSSNAFSESYLSSYSMNNTGPRLALV